MISIESYVQRSQHKLRRWLVDPRVHTFLRGAGYFLGGFVFSAASLEQAFLPLALAAVCAGSGWTAVLTALGGGLGYQLFWPGEAQAVFWLLLGLAAALLLGRQPMFRDNALMMPAVAGLIVAVSGAVLQFLQADNAPIGVFLLRVGLSIGATWLFVQIQKGRNPVLEWLIWGLGVLSLVQIVPVAWFSFGFLAAGVVAVVGPFPAVAVVGLALDLAQVTPVPMTAVLVLSYLLRLLPKSAGYFGKIAPAITYLAMVWVCKAWDFMPVPALAVGALVGQFLPVPGKVIQRRGETGVAQVRLELAAGVLSQTQQMLLETPEVPVDEDALVTRAAERACSGCPNRRNCKDIHAISTLPGLILHKPLAQAEELPIVCRKSGRFLAELHRSQELLRSIKADRGRQQEYRAAVIQQYRFLSEYLQNLSDKLSQRTERKPIYFPRVTVYGNRPEEENGDYCLRFAGTEGRYYVLLCDGMGTGLGAIQEGRAASGMLRRMLTAGYPAEYALRSINSLCALRDRAGAVTIDLAEIRLDTGRVTLYKWGAVPSYLITGVGAERLGVASPPPGLSVTDCQESTQQLTLRRGQLLVMVSDGIGQREAMSCCANSAGKTPSEIAAALLSTVQASGQDDATVAVITLEQTRN